MTEWVVTLRNGKRKEIEAESFIRFPEWIEVRSSAARESLVAT